MGWLRQKWWNVLKTGAEKRNQERAVMELCHEFANDAFTETQLLTENLDRFLRDHGQNPDPNHLGRVTWVLAFLQWAVAFHMWSSIADQQDRRMLSQTSLETITAFAAMSAYPDLPSARAEAHKMRNYFIQVKRVLSQHAEIARAQGSDFGTDQIISSVFEIISQMFSLDSMEARAIKDRLFEDGKGTYAAQSAGRMGHFL